MAYITLLFTEVSEKNSSPSWILPVLIFIAVIIAIYLYLIHTGKDNKEKVKILNDWDYGHRGLYDISKGIHENTIESFGAAVDNGYGSELDVQLTKDGQVVVVHDFNLLRLCGVDKKVSELTYEEITALRVSGSNSSIPLFADVMKIFEGKAPMIIEIKSKGDCKEICRKTDELLTGYKGIYCIESFNPNAVLWYRRNRPEIIRGQLASDFIREKAPENFFIKFAMTNLLLNFMTKPDFIAYNYKYSANISFRICLALYKPYSVSWTISNQEEYDLAKKICDIIIFEKFIPIRH